mmetsp:Transcript_4506/g.7896  ORF Transcript_4506/g.7896 Transcript_4506/m.7896 type:complete len:330 (+) Transcript_4506:70-1059(+)
MDWFGELVFRIYKWIMRRITGRSEIERVARLYSTAQSTQDNLKLHSTTLHFIKLLRQSKKLSNVTTSLGIPSSSSNTKFNDVQQNLNTSSHEIIQQAFTQICSIKRISSSDSKNSSTCTALKELLQIALTLGTTIQSVIDRQRSRYNSDNPQHEILLEKLWNVLTNNAVRTNGRVTSEWGTIGFQGKDPATDFRGGGEFALVQLIQFVEKYPDEARRFLKEPKDEVARYPMACCGIGISCSVVEFLKSGLLDDTLVDLQTSELQESRIHKVFCDLWLYFHEFYVDNHPETVMDFPRLYKMAVANAEAALTRSGNIESLQQGPNANKKLN